MKKGKQMLRKTIAIVLMIAMVVSLTPMIPGAEGKAWAATDKRTEINLVEATSDVGQLVGYKNVYAEPEFEVEVGSPASFAQGKWMKLNQREGTLEEYNGSNFVAGIYTYVCEVHITKDNGGANYKLASAPIIEVNGEAWTTMAPAVIFDTSSSIFVYSPTYTVTAQSKELLFKDSDSYDIEEAYAGTPIDSFSVAEAVSGGTFPYTFSKVSGPDWITVTADGTVKGTPNAVGTNENLIVRVRDVANAYRDIKISVAKTTEDDGRTIISAVVATSNIDEVLGYGKKNIQGETQFEVTTGSPAYFNSNSSNGDWERLVDGEWKIYEDSVFIEGTYRFSCQVRVDGNAGQTHKMSKKLKVSVDGKAWSIGFGKIFSNVSYTFVTSPVYTIEKPADAPLVFVDSESFDIKTPYVNHPITSYSLKDQVSGGTAPYTFSKVSGPDWITVSAEGTVSGTPIAAGTGQDLIVRVTDAAENYKEITIRVGNVDMHPDERIVVSKIVAESNFSELLGYGKLHKRGAAAFNVTTGAPAYFNSNASNGVWERLVDGEWKIYEGSVFIEGTYRFSCQVRIDEPAGKTHMLDEDSLSVTVDDKVWSVGNGFVMGTYSYFMVTSPEYVIETPIVVPLVFADDDSFDIPESFVGTGITSFSVSDAVSGGTEPYTFSKTKGPDWLNVAGNGTISGVPDAARNGDEAVIRVTDNAGDYKEITIKIARIYPDPATRTAVTTIAASSNIDVALGGAVEQPTITVTEGTEARFVISATKGKWYVKNGEEWEAYTEAEFGVGTYRFECPVTIDGENGKSYVLGNELSVTVDGKAWTVKSAPVITNTSSTVDVYSVEYVVDEMKYGITVTTDGNGAAGASATSAEKGEVIALQATPNTGFEFKGWQVTPAETVVTDNCFTMPESAVTVKALFKPVITKHPKNVTVNAGETANFSIDYNAAYDTYLWQFRATEADEWAAATGNSGYATHSMNVKATSGYDGYQYRCIVTDGDGNEGYSNPATLTVKKNSISDAVITISENTFTYDGTAKTPAVTSVVLGGNTLEPEVDYTVSYKDNVNAGTATVIVTGKGNYTGQQTLKFDIVKNTPAVVGGISRLAGATRFGTSAEISKGFIEEDFADAICIVNGMDFPDALAAAPFAAQEGAPILMSIGGTGVLTDEIIEEINRIDYDHSAKIYLIGGDGAVNPKVKDTLKELGYGDSDIERVAGDNRFLTAIEVAKKVPDAKTAYIAYSHNYPDALGAGSAAALNDGVILFTAQNVLTGATKEYLKTGGFTNVVILGGEGAVGKAVENELNSMFPGKVERIAGSNRYLTSLAVAKKFFPETDTIVVATGDNFADALAGGPLAADLEAPMILLNGTGTSIPADIQQYIKDSGAEHVVVLGGTGAVSEAVYKQLENLIK